MMLSPRYRVLLASVAVAGLVSAVPQQVPSLQASQVSNQEDAALRSYSQVRFSFRLGLKRKTTLTLQGAGAKPLVLTLEAGDGTLRKHPAPLEDALVKIQLTTSEGVIFKEDYYIRPNPYSYKGQERTALLERWATLPSASQHELQVKFITTGDDVSIWVDDRFVGSSPLTFPAAMRIGGTPVSLVRTHTFLRKKSPFVPLSFQGYSRGAREHATLPFKRGEMQSLGGVPFQVAAPGEVLDIAQTRWLGEKVGPEDYADTQYSRSSFDRRPDNALLAVPTDDYSQAHVLAAVDPDPNKTPVLSLAFTRLLNDSGDSGGRGDGVAYSTIRLERKNGRWPQGVRQVGTVKGKDGAGRDQTMPLLQVTIPIRSGEIPDVIDETGIVRGRSTQYMDLELSRELQPVRTKNYSTFSIKPVGKPSAALVYGLTLERAPVKVRLRPRQTGNIFSQTENVGFDLALENRTGGPFAGKVRYQLTDFYGKTITREQNVRVQDASSTFSIDLKEWPLGWNEAEISLLDSKGSVVWSQPTSFAVLAPNTRRAGQESPYGAWWFRSIHGGTDSTAEIAPLYQRMGFRHVNPVGAVPKPEGAVLAEHGLSLSTLPYLRKGSVEEALAQLDNLIAKNPGVNRAMVFHESGSGAGWQFPPEFIGKPKPTMNEKQQASYDNAVPRGIAYARAIREKYPHLELVVGNGPLPFISGLMQNGYPKELVDAWGDEEVGQAIIPEAPPNSGQSDFYWIAEYSKKYGYNKPVTTAYEWRGRGTNPGNLTELKQAQYYTRDVLRALAYGAKSINPGLIHDAGDAYYYSRWGSGGYTRRYPLLTPKPSYVAMAVLTQQLDQAKFVRVRETDSLTLHALEFKQNDEFVTALWVPRGEKMVRVGFADEAKPTIVDMNGRSVPVAMRGRQATITVSDSPLYLRSTAPVAGFNSGATVIAAPKPVAIEIDLSQWKLDTTPDAELETAHFDFPRHLGNIIARPVADAQKKTALELTLHPQPELPWPVERYITLRPQQPTLLAGQPESVGVWVKGNSNWGRVLFELRDAKGEKFSSLGAGDSGWNLADWEGVTAINFDGWNYISVKLPKNYASGFYQPQQNNWRSSGGDGVVDYPVQVSKLVVTMRDKIVQVDRLQDVKQPRIRLSGLGGN